jgi:hypothetical protein
LERRKTWKTNFIDDWRVIKIMRDGTVAVVAVVVDPVVLVVVVAEVDPVVFGGRMSCRRPIFRALRRLRFQ